MAKVMQLATDTSSLVNYILSSTNNSPIVGGGGTFLMWTDRKAFEVLEVLDNGIVKIQDYVEKKENGEYVYNELNGYDEFLICKKGVWYKVYDVIDFKKKHYAAFELAEKEKGYQAAKKEFLDPLYDSDNNLKLIEGKTSVKKQYHRVNLIFGSKDSYIDPSF